MKKGVFVLNIVMVLFVILFLVVFFFLIRAQAQFDSIEIGKGLQTDGAVPSIDLRTSLHAFLKQTVTYDDKEIMMGALIADVLATQDKDFAREVENTFIKPYFIERYGNIKAHWSMHIPDWPLTFPLLDYCCSHSHKMNRDEVSTYLPLNDGRITQITLQATKERLYD